MRRFDAILCRAEFFSILLEQVEWPPLRRFVVWSNSVLPFNILPRSHYKCIYINLSTIPGAIIIFCIELSLCWHATLHHFALVESGSFSFCRHAYLVQWHFKWLGKWLVLALCHQLPVQPRPKCLLLMTLVTFMQLGNNRNAVCTVPWRVVRALPTTLRVAVVDGCLGPFD